MTNNGTIIQTDVLWEINPMDTNETSFLSHLQPDGWVDIVPCFDFYTKSSFCFPVKVSVNNECVGIGATIIHNEVAWLAHIIVHSDFRHKGIGLQITKSLVKIAKENHCATMYLIATELGEPIYRKIGFITETEYLVYKNITKKDWAVSKNISQFEERHRTHFAIFDREVSGEDRMIHLEEHLINGFVYHQADNVEGYYLPTLGEGLIIAETEISGIELLKVHLRHNDRIVIPKENLVAQKFMQEVGFEEVKSIKRMRLGKERKVQFANLYNRIGGNVG
jgi:N-acetylglutamate synthase-like GNAT family acetyltransferase